MATSVAALFFNSLPRNNVDFHARILVVMNNNVVEYYLRDKGPTVMVNYQALRFDK